MNIIDAFVVTFGLDTKGFEKGEREVTDASRRLRDSSKRTFDDMENQSKQLGESLKRVRNEVVGLGLAFMGAKSISGLVSGMMTGAAAADRMGRSIGMSVKQIWAWRRAAQEQGGQQQDADAALQSIQNDRMALKLGQIDAGRLGAYGRLGISGEDLRTSNSGAVLQKIAGMQGKMDPQLYANMLQQIGLPNSISYFLQQGKQSVDSLLKQYENSAGEMQKLATEQEKLTRSVIDLQNTITGKLVGPLEQIAGFLNRILGSSGSEAPKSSGGGSVYKPGGFWGSIFGEVYHPSARGSGSANAMQATAGGGGISSGPHGAESQVYSFLRQKGLASDQALGITAALWAESRLDPNSVNPSSGAYGISQWLGTRKRELLRRYGAKPTLDQQLDFLWWELSGGDHGGKAVLGQPGVGTASAMIRSFMRPKQGGETLGDLRRSAAFIRDHRSNGSIVIHGGIHIKTAATDAKGIAHDIHNQLRRRQAVARSDRGVNP